METWRTRVINLIAYEFSSKEIANKLCVSPETIRTHRKNIMSKLSVKNVARHSACRLSATVIIGVIILDKKILTFYIVRQIVIKRLS